jgi:NAD(P)-dependent dehydrogenase (short-subunit alcohol dehydrogenase family)
MATAEPAGKRVLVTGGTKGMGEAIVRHLRHAGATVFTTARSTPVGLAELDLFVVEADIGTADPSYSLFVREAHRSPRSHQPNPRSVL